MSTPVITESTSRIQTMIHILISSLTDSATTQFLDVTDTLLADMAEYILRDGIENSLDAIVTRAI